MASDSQASATRGGSSALAGLVSSGTWKALVIILLIAAGSLYAIAQDPRFIYLTVYVWFGSAYGMLLQYGRFCMASAVRDLFAVGVPRMAVGVLIAVVLFSLTAAFVNVAGVSTFAPSPLGWHILIGGAIFGFGMVLAGGCASGSLYKSGEGNIGSMVVVLAISFSQPLFVSTGGWLSGWVPESWTETALAQGMPEELAVADTWFDQFLIGHIWHLDTMTFANLLGTDSTIVNAFVGNALIGAILPSLLLVTLIYILFYRKGYMRRNRFERATLADHFRGMWAMLTSSRETALAGLGLGIFAGLHMYVIGSLRDHYRILNFGQLLNDMGYTEGLSIQNTVFDPGYWYITTQEAQWGGWVLDKLGIDQMSNVFFGLENGIPNPLLNAPGMMSIGIILGAAVLALVRKEFKWKWPGLETIVFALIAGTLMGIGARIAMGCNIGAFFAAVTNGDPSGWLFLIAMAAGAWVGVKFFNLWFEWRAARDIEL